MATERALLSVSSVGGTVEIAVPVEAVLAVVAGSVGLLCLLVLLWHHHRVAPVHQPCEAKASEAPVVAELEHAGGAEKAVLVGSRVQFVGLRTTADLNETYGVVLRYDDDCGRYAVRKEIALSGQPHTVTARAANLRSVRPLETLAELQQLVDSAPAGARVTLPRGTVSATAAAATAPAADAPIAASGDAVGAGAGKAVGAAGGGLVLSSAISLAGMGCRAGGTILRFGVAVGEHVEGELVSLSGLHLHGALDVSTAPVGRLGGG